MTHVHKAGRYMREQMSPWAIALLALITAVAFTIPFLLADPAAGSHLDPGPPTTTLFEQPVNVHGNPSCSDLISEEDFLFEEKFEPVEDIKDFELSSNGVTGELDVDVYNTPQGQAFDFDTTGFIAVAVFVKAGDNGNFYDYRPDGANGAVNVHGDPGLGDTFLHGAINPNNNRFFGLSHISFCLAPAPQPSETVTTPSASTITIGDSVTDTAVVTGNETFGAPTGSVTFHICAPNELDGNGECSTGGTLVSTNALSAINATQSTATSDSFTPTSTGTWCFRGEYSGDDNYEASEDHATTECVTVEQAPSQTVTTPSADPITIGDSVTDTAVVTGNATTGVPTGTVTFFICAPGELDTNGECSTGGTQVGSAVTLTPGPGANEASATSDPFTPTSIGEWCFRGEYSGDDNYEASEDHATTECVTVEQAPTAISTDPWIYPNDNATISASAGGNVAGSVDFALYNNLENCEAGDTTGLLYSETVNLSGGQTSETVSTSNTTVKIEADAIVYWRVSFTSTNPDQESRNSHCVETIDVDLTADAGPGTAP